MKLAIELGDDGYQLVVDGEESGVTPYGETAETAVGENLYTCLVESKEEALATPPIVYQMLMDEPVVEEVEFEIEA